MKKTILYIMMLMSVFVLNTVVSNALVDNCTNLTTDITINLDEKPYISSTQTDFLAILPNHFKTHSMKCWTYVSKDGELQQVNPQKLEYSKTFFSLAKKVETREYFTAQNGVLNAYFTQKNLVAYTTFVLEVSCVSEDTGETVIGQKCVTPYYKELKEVPARGVWATENMEMIVVISVVVIFLLIIIGVVYRKIFK